MKVLWVTIEFTNTFSGNGRLSECCVRGLLQAGHDVCVLCACPSGSGDQLSEWTKMAGVAQRGGVSLGKFSGFSVEVPAAKWKATDRLSGWEEFGKVPAEVAAGVVEFGPSVVHGVDWTAEAPYAALLAGGLSPSIPFVFANYRVYFNQSNNTEDDRAFYRERETAVLKRSQRPSVTCLSKMDQDLLRELGECSPELLLPPLREEVAALAEQAPPVDDPARKLLLCCCRVAKDKNTHCYVDVIENCKEALSKAGIVPCMVGATGDQEYAKELRGRFKAAFPDGILKEHVSTDELCGLFRQTAINIHPALYEAYGMTIAEAGAFTAPTLLHKGTVGASALLGPGPDEPGVFEVDMSDPVAVAGVLTDLLADRPGRVYPVAERARERALTYKEAQMTERLLAILAEA